MSPTILFKWKREFLEHPGGSSRGRSEETKRQHSEFGPGINIHCPTVTWTHSPPTASSRAWMDWSLGGQRDHGEVVRRTLETELLRIESIRELGELIVRFVELYDNKMILPRFS